MDINLYLGQAKRTGYCIMNEFDFVVLPLEVYKKLIDTIEAKAILNDYYNVNNNKHHQL